MSQHVRDTLLGIITTILGLSSTSTPAESVIVVTPPGITCANDPRLTVPVAGQDFCFEASTRALKGWDGTRWRRVESLPGAMFDVTDFGASQDLGATTGTSAVQAAVNALPTTGGVVYIPWGVKWVHTAVTPKKYVSIIDDSGYNPADDPTYNGGFTGGRKVFLWMDSQAPPTTNYGNELRIHAVWHPALVIENHRPGVGQARQASIVFRSGDISQAQISNDWLGNDTGRFVIAQNTPAQAARYYWDPIATAALGDGATLQSGQVGNLENKGFVQSLGVNDTTGRPALSLKKSNGVETWLRNTSNRDLELASARNGGTTYWAIPSNHFRGQVTVSGASTRGTYTFRLAEPSTAYHIVLTPTARTGTPAAGSNRVLSVTKNTATFVVTVESAPGGGNSVTFDFILVR